MQSQSKISSKSLVHRLAYSRYEEMLADPKVEAVIIGVADQFHVSAASKSVQGGDWRKACESH
jgi:predicted dehydrogenase